MVRQHTKDLENGEERKIAVASAVPHLVYMKTTVQGLYDPIVPFTIFYSNPVVDFYRRLEVYQQAVGTASLGVGTLRDAWNEQFEDVRSEEKFFICAWSSVRVSSPAVVRSAGLLCRVVTPGPQQRRWFTTRAVWWQEELVAWCQEIDMRSTRADQITVVTLSEQRMIHLTPASIYTVA